MRHYETKAVTRTDRVCVKVTCDLCRREAAEPSWQLQVWPTTGRPEAVIDAGPRQPGGTGGRGRMWMTGLREGRELQDLPIPLK
jgi:hypothetical protein